jgi:hypothetical protein
MKLRSRANALAILASVTLPVVAATATHAADSQDLTWSKDRLSKFDAAIASEQDTATHQGAASQGQAFEIDAAIASLEQDFATRRGDGAARGQTVLNEIRATRDSYRAKLSQLATNARADARAADSRQSPREASNAFWSKVNAYLDTVGADLATRQAAMQTRFLGN